MAIVRLQKWVTTILDTDGNPAQGYQVKAYIDGSTTPTDTYSDSSGTVASYPLIVPADGVLDIYISDAIVYKFEIFKPDGVTKVRTITDIDASGAVATPGTTDLQGAYDNGNTINIADFTPIELTKSTTLTDKTIITYKEASDLPGDDPRFSLENDRLTITNHIDYLNIVAGDGGSRIAVTEGEFDFLTLHGSLVRVDRIGAYDQTLYDIAGEFDVSSNSASLQLQGNSTQYLRETARGDVSGGYSKSIVFDNLFFSSYVQAISSGYYWNHNHSGTEHIGYLSPNAYTDEYNDGNYESSIISNENSITRKIIGTDGFKSQIEHYTNGGESVNQGDLSEELYSNTTAGVESGRKFFIDKSANTLKHSYFKDGVETRYHESIFVRSLDAWIPPDNSSLFSISVISLGVGGGHLIESQLDNLTINVDDATKDFALKINDIDAIRVDSDTASSLSSASDGDVLTYNATSNSLQYVSPTDLVGLEKATFKARASGSWDIDSSTSSITIPFNAASAGTILNYIDTRLGLADGVYTIPASGQYSITVKTGLIHSGANASSVTECYVNVDKYEAGSWVVVGELRCKILANGVEGICNTTYLDLVAGDLVRASIKLVGSASANSVTVDRWFEFSGHKV